MQATDNTARPKIVYKTGSAATETQYHIVSPTNTLDSGECHETGTGVDDKKIYTCKYTGSSLSGVNLFKSYVTAYTDYATNPGTAQTYDTNSGGVTIAANSVPTVTLAPADDTFVNVATDPLTITFSDPIYADSSGTAFTDETVANILTLNTKGPDGLGIGFDATIVDEVITLTPKDTLPNDSIYFAISDAWYYGANAVKTQGTVQTALFTVDTITPTVTASSTDTMQLTFPVISATLPLPCRESVTLCIRGFRCRKMLRRNNQTPRPPALLSRMFFLTARTPTTVL